MIIMTVTDSNGDASNDNKKIRYNPKPIRSFIEMLSKAALLLMVMNEATLFKIGICNKNMRGS